MKRQAAAALLMSIAVLGFATARADTKLTPLKSAAELIKKAGHLVSADIARGVIRAADRVGKCTCVCAPANRTIRIEGVYAGIQAQVKTGLPMGARAGISAGASLGIGATGTAKPSVTQGSSTTGGGSYKKPSVNIGGVPVGAQVDGRAYRMAGAVARAEAGIQLKGDPHINLGAEAFAGARVGAEGSFSMGCRSCANVCGKAEGWAGVGARMHCDMGFAGSKSKLGAALGTGACTKLPVITGAKKVAGAVKRGASSAAATAKASTAKASTKSTCKTTSKTK